MYSPPYLPIVAQIRIFVNSTNGFAGFSLTNHQHRGQHS